MHFPWPVKASLPPTVAARRGLRVLRGRERFNRVCAQKQQQQQQVMLTSRSRTPRAAPPTTAAAAGAAAGAAAAGGSSALGCMYSSIRGFAVSLVNPTIQRGVLYPRVPQPYMLIVLQRSVPGLGKEGELRFVRRGFFRHVLAKQGTALPATWQNIDRVQAMLQQQQQRQQQQQQQQQQLAMSDASRGTLGKIREGVLTSFPPAAAAAAPVAPVPVPVVPLEDEGLPVLAWLRGLRLRFSVETEATDNSLLREPLTLQHVLQKLSEEVGVDLLPHQLRLIRFKRQQQMQQQLQQQVQMQEDEVFSGACLRCMHRTGEYEVAFLLKQKGKTLVRKAHVEVVSKQQDQWADRREQSSKEKEAPPSFCLGLA
ncbi:hypothetical protein Esti_003628 [Eimeria stiedai]